MEKNRLEKYQRKISFILKNLHDLPSNENENRFYWDIIFYRFHTSIQALMDIIAMICKDLGIDVQDDYSNIEHLADIPVIDSETISYLKKLNGLRNVLVHRYNHIETNLISDEIDEITEKIFNILEKMEKIIHEFEQ